MRLPTKLAVAMVAALALIPSCENSDTLAPSDGMVILTASPARVTVDPVNGPISAQSTIVAQFFDGDNFPLQGVAVSFSASGGTLASAPGGVPMSVRTNQSGFATDVLTVVEADEPEVVVTARSGVLLETVTVDIDVAGRNQLPSATVSSPTPGSTLMVGPVSFVGSGTDPDPGDSITCYEWSIASSSSTPDSDGIGVFRSTSNVLQKRYGQFTPPSTVTGAPQTLSVLLRVSDDDSAPCAQGSSIVFGSAAAAVQYFIVCDPSGPTAEAGPASRVVSLAAGGVLTLNGAASVDPQTSIVRHDWDCGNGTEFPSGPTGVCNYGTTGPRTVVLTVENGCGQVATDTINVTVNP